MKHKKINTAFETVILLLAIASCVLFFLALVSMLAACSQDQDKPIPPEPTEVENKQVFQVQVGNDQREYIIYVPSSYNENSDYPLVCHLHGGSGNGEKHYNISGWNEVAEENGFLVAYPTAWAYNKSDNGCQDSIEITLWNHYELKDDVCAEDDLRDDVVGAEPPPVVLEHRQEERKHRLDRSHPHQELDARECHDQAEDRGLRRIGRHVDGAAGRSF